MITPYPIGKRPSLFKLLVYGKYGTGKTLLACGAARHQDMSPALLVNIENGGGTVTHIDSIDQTPQLLTTADVNEVYWALANRQKTPSCDWSAYKTVIIDSVTALVDISLCEIAKANSSSSKPATRRSQQDYGDMTLQVTSMLRNFCSLPVHVIATAGIREIYPDTASTAKREQLEPLAITPAMTPKLCSSANHIFDHVWALKYDGVKRRLLLDTDGKYAAKTRGVKFAKKLGKIIDVPDEETPLIPMLYDQYIETQTKDKR